jgi:hypothetical protein
MAPPQPLLSPKATTPKNDPFAPSAGNLPPAATGLSKNGGYAAYEGLARKLRLKRQGVQPLTENPVSEKSAEEAPYLVRAAAQHVPLSQGAPRHASTMQILATHLLGRPIPSLAEGRNPYNVMRDAEFLHNQAQTMQKSAAAPSVPARLISHLVPVGPRRDPMLPEEEEEIQKGQGQWLPKMLQTDSTSIPQMMASPTKQGILAGAGGAALGGVGAAGLGALASKFAPGLVGGDTGKVATIAGLLGAGVGGVGVGLNRYRGQNKRNEHMEEVMRRLPPGSTKHDYVNAEMLWEALMARFGGNAIS